jgi:uncharacterized membrane protein YdbT with pleckstrin-like domain
MGYVERTLVEGEQVLARGQLHWIVYVRAAVFFAICIAALAVGYGKAAIKAHGLDDYVLGYWLAGGYLALIFAAVSVVRAFIKRRTTEIAVTTRRFIVKRGLVRRAVMEIGSGQIESIILNQPILGRIFDYGTLVVSGTGSHMDPVQPVAAPLALRKALDRLYLPSR